MAIKFRPMPGLTIATLICTGILLYLGTWQYQRLQWKTELITQIDEAANAAPLTTLAQVTDLMACDVPIDFRRISLDGHFVTPEVNDGKSFHLLRSSGKALTWRLYQVFTDGTRKSYVATTEYTDSQSTNPPTDIKGPKTVTGYVRLVRPSGRYAIKSNPQANRWFSFNHYPEQLDWAGPHKNIDTAYYIEWDFSADNAAALPVRKPDIRNNHLDYMLTWYSFVIILLVIYFLLHKKAGRLSFGKR